MIWGMSGTRERITGAQLETAFDWVRETTITEFHHGDCVGADEQMHLQIYTFTNAVIYVHPPLDNKLRAYCGPPEDRVIILPEKDYLSRNRDIVRASERMLFLPRTQKMQRRSGTWYTIRYARSLGVPHVIIYPNGCKEVFS